MTRFASRDRLRRRGPVGHTAVDAHPGGLFSLDAHGSVLARSDGDPLAAAAGYDPHGVPDGHSPGAPTAGQAGPPAALSYRGELHVGDTVHLRHRDYHPETGVFTTTDSLDGLDGEVTVSNPYHYAANDPLNRADPLGLSPFKAADDRAVHHGTVIAGPIRGRVDGDLARILARTSAGTSRVQPGAGQAEPPETGRCLSGARPDGSCRGAAGARTTLEVINEISTKATLPLAGVALGCAAIVICKPATPIAAGAASTAIRVSAASAAALGTWDCIDELTARGCAAAVAPTLIAHAIGRIAGGAQQQIWAAGGSRVARREEMATIDHERNLIIGAIDALRSWLQD